MDFVLEIPNNLSPEVCEDIIKRFEKDDRKIRGVTGDPDNTTVKLSTDLNISGLDEWKDIDTYLHNKLREGLEDYRKYLSNVCAMTDLRVFSGHDAGYQIQRTVTGGYYSWHHDQDFHSKRTITFLWYLNDIHVSMDGGGTAFHPSIGGGKVITPEQGKLILFPATWTFVHMGLPLIATDKNKYVCTGWVHTDV